MKIKQFIALMWSEGHRNAYHIWRATQAKFPYKCCSWSYVSKIIRDLKAGENK